MDKYKVGDKVQVRLKKIDFKKNGVIHSRIGTWFEVKYKIENGRDVLGIFRSDEITLLEDTKQNSHPLTSIFK